MAPQSSSLRILAVITVLYTITDSSKIKIGENGGYTNLVVGISPELINAGIENLMKSLEEIFQRASSTLHLSTRNYFYFEEVIFAVSSNFNSTIMSQFDFELAGNSFSDPDMILMDNGNLETEPFTLQHGECGKPGMRIYLPAYYLQNKAVHKVLVHEWARYRYGVFEEHGFNDDPVYPVIYRIPGTDDPLVTGCTNDDPIYTFMNSSGSPCQAFSGDCLPVLQEENNPGIVSSLMDQKTSTKITQFCDGMSYPHNRDAPSMQNNLCRERSTWEVIFDNTDFKEKNPVVSLPTKFRYVLEVPPRVVFVIEATDKLRDHDRMELVRNALSYFLLYDFPGNGKICLLNLRKLVSASWSSNIESLLDAFPEAYGNVDVCVFCGISEATKLLTQDGNFGGYIITITVTDIGIQELTKLEESLSNSEVKLFSLYFGDPMGNPPQLQQLAELTGGQFLHVLETTRHHEWLIPLTFLYETFRSIYESFSWTNNYKALVEERVFYEEAMEGSMSFVIDDSIEGFQVVMTGRDFHSDPPILMESITLKLNNTEIGAAFAYRRRIPAYILTVPDAQAGRWELSFQRKRGNPRPVVVILRANNRNYNEIIVLKPRVTPNRGRNRPWSLYAEIRRGYEPVKNVEVKAVLYHHGTGKEISLRLYDSGEGNPDVRRNDGIYSRGLTGIIFPGYYTMTVMAQKYSRDPEDDGNLIYPTVSSFSRITSFGTLYFNSSKVDYPPRRIVDLHISDVRTLQYGVKHFVVKWTAPGDEFDSGLAERYEMKVFRNRDDALMNFNEKQLSTISEWDVHGPWLKPEIAGSFQSLIIQLNNLTTGSYFLAMRTTDRDGNNGEVSNVVKVYHKEPVYPPSSSYQTTVSDEEITTETQTNGSGNDVDKQNDGTNFSAIVGVTCGILFLMIVIAVFLLVYLTNKKKTRKSVKDTISPPYFPRQRSNTNEAIYNGSPKIPQSIPIENPAYNTDYTSVDEERNFDVNPYYTIPTISRRVQDNVSIASANGSIIYTSLRRGHGNVPIINNSFYDVPLCEEKDVSFYPNYTSSLRREPSQASRTYRLGTDV